MFRRLFTKKAPVLSAEEREQKEWELKIAEAKYYVPPSRATMPSASSPPPKAVAVPRPYVPSPPKVVFSEEEEIMAQREQQQADQWRKDNKPRKHWSYLQISVDENLIYLFKHALAFEKTSKYKNRTYYLADAMVIAAEEGRCHMLELLVQDHHYKHIGREAQQEVFQMYAPAGLRTAWPPMEISLLEQAMQQRLEIIGQKSQVEKNLRDAIKNKDSPRIELLVDYYAMFYNINDFKGAEEVFRRDDKDKFYDVADIKPFVKHGLDISRFYYIRRRGGYPAAIIFMACEEDDDPLLRFFLDHKVSPQATGSWRRFEEWSPLHECAMKGFSASVALLLERGANANARSGRGDTPLHSMADPFVTNPYPFNSKHLEIVDMLVKHGADVNARQLRDEGKTPYAMASRRGLTELAVQLVANGARSDLLE